MRGPAVRGVVLLLALLVAACGGGDQPSRRGGPAGQAAGGLPPGVKVGKPYQIAGRWYYPRYEPDYAREGLASWYGSQFHGLSTANGETFDKETISAAHPTLPLPSLVRVTNLENGRSRVIRVNDRGPFVDDRLIDLSQAAARELGFERQGLAKVRVEFVEIADGLGVPADPTPPVTVASLERQPLTASSPADGQIIRATFVQDDPTDRRRELVREATAVSHPVEPSAPEPTLVADLTVPAGPAGCTGGPQLVQVGAFADTERVRIARDRLSALGSLHTEPVFIGEHAAMRVRLGPAADRASAERLLALVRATGYPDAFVLPAQPGRARVAC